MVQAWPQTFILLEGTAAPNMTAVSRELSGNASFVNGQTVWLVTNDILDTSRVFPRCAMKEGAGKE